MRYTRMDIVADTVLLQTKVNQASTEDLKAYNTIARKAKEHSNYSLYYILLRAPLRLLGFSDIGFAAAKSSYAVEAFAVLRSTDVAYELCEDKDSHYDSRRLAGPCHVLVQQAKKAKRISHGTSHAESLGSYTMQTAAEMVALRLTEQSWPWQPTLPALTS